MAYRFANRMKELKSSPLRENASKNMELKDVISFAYGFPPVEAFPMETLQKISQKLYTEVDPETFLQYGASEGYPLLRKLVKERLAATANLHNEEQVLITSGSTQAMDIAVKVLCDEGDVVLCEEQTFSGAVNAIKGYGAIPVPIPMNVSEESVDLEALEELLRFDQRIKFIYLIPTFQNPLGTSIPLEKRQEIYSLARKYDVLIFEDDPYGDLLYYGEPIMKLKERDTDGRVMYAGSFSKILAPSARLGFIMAPDAIMEKLALAKQVSDSHTNFYWQVMLAEFMQNHQFEEHVSELKLYYKGKFEAMIAGLEALPEDKIQFIKPTGGYFICCKMSDELDPETFYTALDEAKVAVIPGNIMSVAQEGYDRYFRLNFTKPTLSEIVAGVKVIGEALEQATPASYKQVI